MPKSDKNNKHFISLWLRICAKRFIGSAIVRLPPLRLKEGADCRLKYAKTGESAWKF